MITTVTSNMRIKYFVKGYHAYKGLLEPFINNSSQPRFKPKM